MWCFPGRRVPILPRIRKELGENSNNEQLGAYRGMEAKFSKFGQHRILRTQFFDRNAIEKDPEIGFRPL